MICNYVWDLEGFFRAIPPVVWSGVFGATVAAGISLYGVGRSNANGLTRLREQHDHDEQQAIAQRVHDANQKAEDRKAAIRREVYTKAIDAVHAVLSHIARLPTIRLSEEPQDEVIQQFLQANSKVWLVSEPEAAHLSRELATRVGEMFIDALALSYTTRQKKENWFRLGEKLEVAKSEVRRIETAMAISKERGDSPESLMTIGNSWKSENEWLRTLEQSRARVIEQINQDIASMAPSAMKLMRPVQETIVHLVSALRSDLGLPPDAELFMNRLDDQQQRMQAAVRRVAHGGGGL